MSTTPTREIDTLSESHSPSDYGATMDSVESGNFPFLARFRVPRRFYTVGLAFLGFLNVYAMRVSLSVAVLYIGRNNTQHNPDGSTTVLPPDLPNFDSLKAGVALSSFFYGYLITQLPGGWLACRHGGKLIFGTGIILSGVASILTPLAVHTGYWALIMVRVVQGLFQGVTFPSMMAILSHWSPMQEKTFLATITTSGAHFGTVIALPISAILADAFGWPSIFYFFGVLALLWGILWMMTVGETPFSDQSISKDELKYITSSVGYTPEQINLLHDHIENEDFRENDLPRLKIFRKIVAQKAQSTPWKSILTSAPVWAIIASHFSENWGWYIMLTQLPTYLSKVLHFPTTETSFVAALPYLILGISTPFAGCFADYLRIKKGVDTLVVRKSFNCLAFFAQALFIMLAAHLENPTVVIACITVAIGLSGFVWSAFAVNQLDIAPQYAGVLMGFSNTVATIPGIIGPSVVGALAAHNYASEWQLVFYSIVAVYIFGASIFAIFASADKQRWAEISGGPLMALDD